MWFVSQNRKVNDPRNECGFTIVEMVLVILVLGIISAVAMSRIIGGNSFNTIIVRDQVISLTRIAQQHSLGRADVSVVLTPNVAGDELTIETSDNSGVIDTVLLSLSSVSLSGDVDETASCDTPTADTIDNANPMTIAFAALGNLDDSGVGATEPVSTAVRICINDTANESICISPSGFAYVGDCDA